MLNVVNEETSALLRFNYATEEDTKQENNCRQKMKAEEFLMTSWMKRERDNEKKCPSNPSS